MWLSARGFASVVAHTDRPDDLLVRAHVRGDLDVPRHYIPDLKITDEGGTDHAWRAVVNRAHWVRAVGVIAADPIAKSVTVVDLKVPHATGTRPPAILVSTRPSRLTCSASQFRYRAINREGDFHVRLRCRHITKGAHARLVFRAPYVKPFPLRNGTGTMRVKMDKPPGNAVPLASLRTLPANTDCSA